MTHPDSEKFMTSRETERCVKNGFVVLFASQVYRGYPSLLVRGNNQRHLKIRRPRFVHVFLNLLCISHGTT